MSLPVRQKYTCVNRNFQKLIQALADNEVYVISLFTILSSLFSLLSLFLYIYIYISLSLSFSLSLSISFSLYIYPLFLSLYLSHAFSFSLFSNAYLFFEMKATVGEKQIIARNMEETRWSWT